MSAKRIKEKKFLSGDAGDRTRGLSHAKRTRYHCATSPDVTMSGNICTSISGKQLINEGLYLFLNIINLRAMLNISIPMYYKQGVIFISQILNIQ